MNVETGTEAAQFFFWDYLFQIFGIVFLAVCMASLHITLSYELRCSYEGQQGTFSALSSGLKGLCHEMNRFKGLQKSRQYLLNER